MKINKHICLDLHGIIDAYPEFFSELTQSLAKDGWKITVATGSHLEEDKIANELKGYGIAYTHLFSIADYHRENKTPGMWYDEKGDPWVSDEDWNKTKAEYCKRNNVSFCIDDTAKYANYFSTPFGYMTIQKDNKTPNRYLDFIIAMFEKRKNKAAWKKKSFFQKFEYLVNKHLGFFFCPPFKQGKENQNKQYL